MCAAERVAILPAGWLLGFALLSTAPVLKVGDVQVIEIAQALWVCCTLIVFIRAGFRLRLPGVWHEYGPRYLVFLLLCVVISLLALRLEFFPPAGASWLKRAGVLSIARAIELSLAISSMLASAESFRRSPTLLRSAMDLYGGVAAVSALVSIVGRILLTGEIYTPVVYGFDDRVRGFFNEGGPYGMFLVSAGIVALLRARLFPPAYAPQAPALLALFSVALLLSGSKAGLLAIVLLAAIGALRAGAWRRFILLASASVVLLITVTAFGGKLLNYWLLYQNLEEAAAYHPDDPNYVMGRVAGSLIVPRIVAAHPAAGIGLGNYSLMRNNPEYMQGLPPTDEWDLPGMGLVGVSAELGVPLALFLFLLLLRPLRNGLRRQSGLALIFAAGFQPIALLLGVNLNFFYPWLVTAFALGAEGVR